MLRCSHLVYTLREFISNALPYWTPRTRYRVEFICGLTTPSLVVHYMDADSSLLPSYGIGANQHHWPITRPWHNVISAAPIELARIDKCWSLIHSIHSFAPCCGHAQTDLRMPSEDCLCCYPPGSFPFSQPEEVSHWCQSVPYGEVYPSTPRDTDSDCALSDYAEMNNQCLSEGSHPDVRWTTAPAQENFSHVQPPGNGWPLPEGSPRDQSVHSSNAPAWMSLSHGHTVDISTSPALSHEKSCSLALNVFPDQDVCVLPPGLDLSFAAEPGWTFHGSTPYSSVGPAALPYYYSGPIGTGPPDEFHVPYADARFGPYASPQTYVEVHRAPEYSPMMRAPCHEHTCVHQPMVQKRPLLPRTEGYTMATQPAYGPQRILRPQMPTSHGSPTTWPNVSIPHGHQAGHDHVIRQDVAVQSSPSGLMPSTSVTAPQADVHANVRPMYRPVALPAETHFQDTVGEDFSQFIRYDQDESFVPSQTLR